MSLILDALNRADNERKNQDAVPGLNTVHVSPAIVVNEKPAQKQNLYAAIAIAVVAMVGSIYWFSSKPEIKSGDLIVAKPEVKAVNEAAPNDAAPNDAKTDKNAGLSTSAIQNEVADVPAPSLTEEKVGESIIANKPAPIVEQLYVTPAAQPAVADAQVNELYAAEEATESESVKDPFPVQPAYATRITGAPIARIEAPSRTFASITNVQDFNELPWNTKQQIPTISYQRHNFLAGGISSVVINGQTLGEGNIAASSQLIVQEIFEDGVILKKGNVIFKLRALNGWINM